MNAITVLSCAPCRSVRGEQGAHTSVHWFPATVPTSQRPLRNLGHDVRRSSTGQFWSNPSPDTGFTKSDSFTKYMMVLLYIVKLGIKTDIFPRTMHSPLLCELCLPIKPFSASGYKRCLVSQSNEKAHSLTPHSLSYSGPSSSPIFLLLLPLVLSPLVCSLARVEFPHRELNPAIVCVEKGRWDPGGIASQVEVQLYFSDTHTHTYLSYHPYKDVPLVSFIKAAN